MRVQAASGDVTTGQGSRGGAGVVEANEAGRSWETQHILPPPTPRGLQREATRLCPSPPKKNL